MVNMTTDELAHTLSMCEVTKSEYEYLLGILFDRVMKNYKKVVNSFFMDRKYDKSTFDVFELQSAYSKALMRSIKGYDKEKGGFQARLNTFAYQEFVILARYIFAKKRYSGDSYICFEESENADLCVTDMEESFFTTSIVGLINDFIAADKEGRVIEILMENKKREYRRQAFTEFYGSYGEKERKRVQRVKERLRNFLLDNGVSL